MKLREITQEQRAKYLSDIQKIILDYQGMISEIDKRLASYRVIQYQQAQNVITLSHAKGQKEPLLVEMKNINAIALDEKVAALNELKEKHIEDVAPVTAITYTLELSFIEKELKVMTDQELQVYYKENYLDTNICQLIKIEHKGRSYKDNKTMLPLPEYGVEDYISGQIDNAIHTIMALRQLAQSTLGMQQLDGGALKNVMIPWNQIIHEIEVRNLSSNTKVTVNEMFNYNISK